MVQQQFLAKLDAFGVKRIDAMGADFDPRLHEAVTSVPAPDASAGDAELGLTVMIGVPRVTVALTV